MWLSLGVVERRDIFEQSDETSAIRQTALPRFRSLDIACPTQSPIHGCKCQGSTLRQRGQEVMQDLLQSGLPQPWQH